MDEASEGTVSPPRPGVNPGCVHAAGLTVGDGMFFSVLAVLAFITLASWLRSMSRMF